jgi:hypothetical protein
VSPRRLLARLRTAREKRREPLPTPGRGMWCASGVLAPALSEGALGATVRHSRPTSCRQPEHRSHQTRSAAAASFARCIIVETFFIGKVAARGRATMPDKAGAYCEEKKELFGLVLVQIRCTPVVPLVSSKSIMGVVDFLRCL